MSENDIKQILHELYAVDPDLKSREKDIIAILRTLAIKPHAQYDEAFAATLRTRLLAELAEQPIAFSASSQKRRFTLASLTSMNTTARYSLAGIGVLAIAGIAVFVSMNHYQQNSKGSLALLSPSATITHVSDHAFGTLSSAPVAANGAAQESKLANPSANMPSANAGGGTGSSGAGMMASPMATAMTANGSASAGTGVAGPAAASPQMMRPIRIGGIPLIQYHYAGDAFSQNQAQLDVLKRATSSAASDQMLSAIAQAGFNLADLSTFSGASIGSVNLVQNQSFGYSIYVDLQNGTLSISQNYNEWPQNDGGTPLSASQIPSDSAIIGIANQFMTDHHISMANYGTPIVASTSAVFPLMEPATTAASASASSPTAITRQGMPLIPYYPDSKQVLYPLVVNGMNVYNSAGDKIGMTVEVNVRYNRVANLYGLSLQNYEASAYDAITSTSTIIAAAEHPQPRVIIYSPVMSTSNSNSSSESSNTTTFNLGTPSMAYLDTFETDNSGNSSEFLVPAFVFPITSGTSAAVQSVRNVVVPLIQDFAQQ